MNYKYILFDLDGTITDSSEGITKSVEYALKSYGISVEDLNSLRCFIGPPLAESFEKYFNFNKEEAREAVEVYREYYSEIGIFQNKLYHGIPELLSKLKKQGKKVLMATSKPEVFAKQILEHFHLMKYFDFVGGSNLDGSRELKAEVIAYVLEEYKIKNLKEAVMIGDRKHDIIGAKELGMDSIGVLYGFGNKEEFQKASADYIVEDVEELNKLLGWLKLFVE